MSKVQPAMMASNIQSEDRFVENIFKEESSPAEPQTLPEEMWVTIRHGMDVFGVCFVFAIFVFGKYTLKIRKEKNLLQISLTNTVDAAL